MQIAALDAAIGRDRTLRCAVDMGEGASAIRPFAAADMNFVGVDRLVGLGVNGCDPRQALLRRHHRRDVEQSEPRCFSGRTFNYIRIGYLSTEHLVSAAEPEHMTTAPMMREDVDVPALRAQESKIAARRFGAGNDDERCIAR